MNGDSGWRRLGIGACTVALVLGGCAGDDGAEPPETSPLAEILGWGMVSDQGAGAPEVTDVEIRRQQRVEELIAGCMADDGFEYVPVPPDERMSGPFDEAYALDPADFAERYGYGVTTLSATEPVAPTDPNQQILENLSAQRRQAYLQALWGEAVPTDPDAADPDADQDRDGARPSPGGDQGCHGWANGQVYGDEDTGGMAAGHARFEELLSELELLWERIENDPRLADTDQRWVECMTEAGYPGFDRPHAARQSVFDEYAALRGAGPEPAPDALASLRDFELALAPVDHACREEHIDGPRRLVAYELEGRFVDQHRTQLEAYRDWLAGERPGGD